LRLDRDRDIRSTSFQARRKLRIEAGAVFEDPQHLLARLGRLTEQISALPETSTGDVVAVAHDRALFRGRRGRSAVAAAFSAEALIDECARCHTVGRLFG